MSLPSEDQLAGHNLDEVRAFLDARHPEQFLVFNLSDQNYDTSKLHNQVILVDLHEHDVMLLWLQVADFDWPSKRMVDLELLVDLCTSVDSWLRADINNVVVIHCTVSTVPSSLEWCPDLKGLICMCIIIHCNCLVKCYTFNSSHL